MAIDQNELIAGLDPSPLSQISGAQLLQLISAATYTPTRGGLIVSDEEPDVVENPQFVRYEWRKPIEKNKICRVYNEDTSTWEPDDVGDISVGEDQLVDGAVTLAKLYNPNDITKAGYYIKVNPTGTGFILEAFEIANGSIALTKLDKGSGNAGKLPAVAPDDSGWIFTDINTLIGLLTNNTLSVAKLSTSGSVGSILVTNSDGTSFGFLTPGVDGQVLRSTAAGPTWSNESPRIITAKATSGNLALPGAQGVLSFDHGLSSVPTITEVNCICIVADGDYAVGDVIPLTGVYHESGGNIEYPVGVVKSATQVKVVFSANAIACLKKDGSNLLAMTRANWNIQITTLL